MSLLTKWIRSFPVFQYLASFLHELLVSIIRTGPIPRHVAFIMDGNRRYARQNNLKLHEGHYKGFETAVNVLETCGRLGVRAVTIFAFSIENFNRTPEEIEILFDLIRHNILPVLKENKSTADQGVQIRVLGNRSYLPEDIVQQIVELEEKTKSNNRIILNICFPYTARDDINHVIQELCDSAASKALKVEEITEDMFQQQLYTAGSPPLDILVRSGNVTRLSDFMVWECNSNCNIECVRPLWPDFSVWDTYRIVLKWSYWKTKELALLDGTRPDDKLPPPPDAVSLLPDNAAISS